MGQALANQPHKSPLVAEINGCLASICELLVQENAALAKFNLAKITEITGAKEAAESRLAQLLAQLQSQPQDAVGMQSAWREQLAQIRQQSEHNLSRTQFALQLIEGFRNKLLQGEAQTYNARRAFRPMVQARPLLTSTVG